jgi:hypothetical protein
LLRTEKSEREHGRTKHKADSSGREHCGMTPDIIEHVVLRGKKDIEKVLIATSSRLSVRESMYSPPHNKPRPHNKREHCML